MTNSTPISIEELLSHADWLRRVSRGLLADRDRAEDIVQETWVAALSSPPRHRQNLRGWLAAIARNLAGQHRRREASRPSRERVAARVEDVPDVADTLGDLDVCRRVAGAVLDLDEPYRTVVRLRYFEDFQPAEIAHRLGVPGSTVRNQLRRALGILRSRMDAEHGGERGRWALSLLPIAFAGELGEEKRPGPLPSRGASPRVGIILSLVAGLVAVVALWSLLWNPVSRDDLPNAPSRRVEASPDGRVDTDGVLAHPAERAGIPETDLAAPTSSSPSGASPRVRRGWLFGYIVGAGSHQPLPGASVRLHFDWWRSAGAGSRDEHRPLHTTTDEDGAFEFDGVEAGVHTLTVEHPGYAPRTLTALKISERGRPEPLIVTLEDDTQQLGVIEGRVTDRDGRPVEGAGVAVAPAGEQAGIRTVSDAEGLYRFDRLLPGYQEVRLLSAAPNVRFQVVLVSPQAISRVDFWGGGTLTGRILDARDKPVGQALVELVPVRLRPGGCCHRVPTSEDGRYRIENIDAGRHRVRVQVLRERFFITVADVDLTGADQEVVVRLPDGEIAGRLALPDGDGPPGRRAFTFPVTLFRATEAGTERVGGAYPDEAGRYRIRGVAPGRYRLVVSHRDYREMENELSLRPGERREDIEIQLERLVTGSLRLRVRDRAGRPVDGLSCFAAPLGGDLEPRTADQPEPGLYVFPALEVGTWELLLCRDGFQDKRVRADVGDTESTEIEIWMKGK